MHFTPYVIEQTSKGERSYDIYSRLLKDRIILLSGEIDDAMSSSIIAQLLFLAAENEKEDIYLYINSPGGSITSGMAIFDTINYIKPDVSTICIGLAASMASIILAAGTKGKRYCLENSEVMIHQPLGGIEGQATDIDIHAKRIIKLKEKLMDILSNLSGQSSEKVKADSERDFFMDSYEALHYGLVDQVLKNGTTI